MRWILMRWLPGTKYTRAGYYVCERTREGDELVENIIDGPFAREQAEKHVEMLGGI